MNAFEMVTNHTRHQAPRLRRPLTQKERARIEADPVLLSILVGYAVNNLSRRFGGYIDRDMVASHTHYNLCLSARRYRKGKGTTFRTYATAMHRASLPRLSKALIRERVATAHRPIILEQRKSMTDRSRVDSGVRGDVADKSKLQDGRLQHSTMELPALVANRLKVLTYFQREVIRARYGLGTPQLTLAETADVFKKTRIQIRAIEIRALRKLGAFAR
jgi:DNA-directed RNA polymerase specialized sigma subunit